jgi:hypothetical protein
VSDAEHLRERALDLSGVEEGTHRRRPAFRVAGGVLAVLLRDDHALVHVDGDTAAAAAGRPGVEPAHRGAALVGVRVHLPSVDDAVLGELVTAAWRHRRATRSA